MSNTSEKMQKRNRPSWVLLMLGACAAMTFFGGFAIATLCVIVISAVFGLFHALGEAMARDGFDLPESRQSRSAVLQTVAADDAQAPQVIKRLTTDCAA